MPTHRRLRKTMLCRGAGEEEQKRKCEETGQLEKSFVSEQTGLDQSNAQTLEWLMI